MTERPIIMDAESVRAILAGRKTATRRIRGLEGPSLRMRGPCVAIREACGWTIERIGPDPVDGIRGLLGPFRCPYGEPGDRLWVREGFLRGAVFPDNGGVLYAADREGPRYRPAMHMPRTASRLLLEITEAVPQRLQDMAWDDMLAEGGPVADTRPWWVSRWDKVNARPRRRARSPWGSWCPCRYYVSCPWADEYEEREHRGLPWYIIGNPWVWAIRFKVLRGVTAP